jgi:hypothetical protein
LLQFYHLIKVDVTLVFNNNKDIRGDAVASIQTIAIVHGIEWVRKAANDLPLNGNVRRQI